jgi:hypothetical protein
VTGPVQHVSGPAFLVPSAYAALFVRLLDVLRAEQRRAGLPWPEEMERLRAGLVAVADAHGRSVPGPVPTGTRPEQPISQAGRGQPGTGTKMSAAEVAGVVGKTARWVRKMAQTGRLPGWKTDNGWQFDREGIAEWTKV